MSFFLGFSSELIKLAKDKVTLGKAKVLRPKPVVTLGKGTVGRVITGKPLKVKVPKRSGQ